MEVNGYRLPPAFAQLCRAIQGGQLPAMWVRKNDVDGYGRIWESGDLTILCSLEDIDDWTSQLQRLFKEDGFQQYAPEYGHEPGFISDFTDVSKLVWFGKTGWGAPFAFDFRDNPDEPSIVHWDSYWRRFAPDFSSFMSLFQRSEEAEPDELTDEDLAEVYPSRERKAEILSNSFARLSEAERKELEEGLEKRLEDRGVPAHERRPIIEAWLERFQVSTSC